MDEESLGKRASLICNLCSSLNVSMHRALQAIVCYGRYGESPSVT